MAPTRRIAEYSRAFSRLCHVAALTRTGTTAAAIDGLVASTWAIDPDLCASISGLEEAIGSYFGLHLPEQTLRASQERLLADGRLVSKDGEAGIELTPAEKAAFEQRAQAAKALRNSVKSRWLEEAVADAEISRVPAEDLWRCLETYTAAAFQRHGIHAIELLGGDIAADGDGSLQTFLTSAIASSGLVAHQDGVAAAVRRFFAESTPDKTRYLAGLLDATFTYFAIATDDVTTAYLRESLQPLKIFVDTNVLFGVLDLGEDSFSGIARQLVALVKEGKLPFTFYYHERTAREFRFSIQGAAAVVCQNRWTPELSRAAVRFGEATGALRSAELAYHRQNADTRTPPEVFFSKFEHLERLLEDQGFRIYRESDADDPEATKTKGLRIAEYDEFVKSERPNRLRPYEALDHDVVVWNTVQRLRHAADSPLQSGAIFLTNDYLFGRFEKRRLRAPGNSTSVVVAAQFVQVLRPFIPSTDDFDRGFVENLTLPEFQVAHGDYRVAEEHVLGYLATYAGLQEETALAILSDEILRHQVIEAGPTADMESLIDAAIVRENVELHQANESLQAELHNAQLTSAAAISGLEERLRVLEVAPLAAPTAAESITSSINIERDRAVRELASLRRALVSAAVLTCIVLWLAFVWIAPVIGQNWPVVGDLAHHTRRVPIQVIATAAAPLALVARADRDRRLVWLAVLAVADPLVIAVAALL